MTQDWAIRIGTAFAFLFKTVLVAVVGISYAQAFWFFVRRRFIEIGSVDKLFRILYDPMSFFDPRLIRRATLLLVLAAVSWFLPISAVFAPGILTGSYATLENRLIVGVTGPSAPHTIYSSLAPFSVP